VESVGRRKIRTLNAGERGTHGWFGWVGATVKARASLSHSKVLFDPGLLAEGDLPVAVVFFEEAGYV
jgi:hypothetical protein